MALHVNTSTDQPAVSHETLLTRVGKSQDRGAFVELFEYYAPRIKSYLLKHGADDATAEEVTQNTFITVWEKADRYNPEKAAASTWIFTVARNKRIDMIRRQKFVVLPGDDDAALQNATYEKPEEYADRETVAKLRGAISTLPPEQSALVRMAFFEDKSHQAISDATNLPLGTVKSRLRLAMGKLRNILKPEGDEA